MTGSVTSETIETRRLVEQVVRLADRPVERVLDRQDADRHLGRDRRLDDGDEARQRLDARAGRREQRGRGGAVAAGGAGIADERVTPRDLRSTQLASQDGGAELGRRGGPAEVRRRRLLDRPRHGRLDRARERGLTEAVLEQQRERAQHRRRVRGSGSGDVGRRAVHRLEDARVRVAEAGRRREPEPAGHAGGDVGEDVAERVLHHEHVEGRRVRDDQHRDAVDEPVRQLDVGIVGRRPR